MNVIAFMLASLVFSIGMFVAAIAGRFDVAALLAVLSFEARWNAWRLEWEAKNRCHPTSNPTSDCLSDFRPSSINARDPQGITSRPAKMPTDSGHN